MERETNKECQQLDIHSALYWQKKYLELEEDCKAFLGWIYNLMSKKTETEPFIMGLNDEDGFLSSAMDILRPIWEFRDDFVELFEKHKSELAEKLAKYKDFSKTETNHEA